MFWRGILLNFSIFWSFLTAGFFTNLFVFSMSTLKGRWKGVTSLTYCFFQSEVCSLMRPFPGQWPMWKRRFLNLVGSVRSNSAWFCPRCCCFLVISGDIWWYDGVGPVWVSRESWSGINLMLNWVGLTSFTLLATELSASYVYRVVCNDCVLLLLFLLALNHTCLLMRLVFLRFQPKRTNLNQTNCRPLSTCFFCGRGRFWPASFITKHLWMTRRSWVIFDLLELRFYTFLWQLCRAFNKNGLTEPWTSWVFWPIENSGEGFIFK